MAILGGGPSGLFMLKRLVESELHELEVDIFETRKQLGAGMPYSTAGANDEHITNVSGNEIPIIVTPVSEWIKTIPQEMLQHFHFTEKFNDHKVLPRLLFGQYLSAQFDLLLEKARTMGMVCRVHFESTATDIINYPEFVVVEIGAEKRLAYDQVFICTGHYWPKRHEGKVPGYFDSPYPPAKLAMKLDHPIAIKGSSLTAVDAIRTLARHHGTFDRDEEKTTYQLSTDHQGFKIVLHTRHGMLPAVRFHLDNSHLENKFILSKEQVAAHIVANGGFLSLDFIFEKDFKEVFRIKEPEFYEHIKDMNMETFVADMMELRERLDPFLLLHAEYQEAEKSIKRKESVYWKEMLGVLSFAMNYPAKYLSAEDMQRLQKVLHPLIAIVIAYIPQSSAEELMALHRAGVLDIMAVGDDATVEACAEGGAFYRYDDQAVHFQTYIDCAGQPHLDHREFPFKSLLKDQVISPARLKFRSTEEGRKAVAEEKEVEQDADGNFYLRVPGITINDSFQVVDAAGVANQRIYVMAVPYIGGYNPDYSGLDFCQEASRVIIQSLLKNERAKA